LPICTPALLLLLLLLLLLSLSAVGLTGGLPSAAVPFFGPQKAEMAY
jgi:hypothetical protein